MTNGNPWTADRILALAPDAQSAQAGRGLSSPAKWTGLGVSGALIWGECKGSGKDPYQTRVELSEPAFKCSCPSRKFPCKHALGLMLVHTANPSALPAAEPPPWVGAWQEGRSSRAGAKDRAKEKPEGAPPTDPKAQARRARAREAKVEAGLAEFGLWLRDLVRGGLSAAPGKPAGFWDAAAARLVDAQAPGLARLVRELPGVVGSGEGWPDRLLGRLGRLHAVAEGYGRLTTLPEPVRADLRAAVGIAAGQDEALAAEGVRGRWRVLGERVEPEGRLRVRRTWLESETERRVALLLDFAAAKEPFAPGPLPAGLVEAELVYYPSNLPMRARLKGEARALGPLLALPGEPTLEAALANFAEALARLPWLERYPLGLADVVPERRGEGWWLRDGEDRLLPLKGGFPHGWRLLALSGGHPLAVFGEFDGEAFAPLTVGGAGGLHVLPAWGGAA